MYELYSLNLPGWCACGYGGGGGTTGRRLDCANPASLKITMYVRKEKKRKVRSLSKICSKQ